MTQPSESVPLSPSIIGTARRNFLMPRSDWAGLAAATMALSATYAWVGVYWGQVVILLMINAMLVMSYRLITTMGGWSFAHVAFAAIGAYTMALLTTVAGVSFWVAIFAGFFVAGAAALLLAYPVLRTRQYNFFLATFAASAAIQQSLIQFSGVTGGTNGIAFIARPSPLFGIRFDTNIGFFALVLVITLLAAATLLAFDRSRLGRTIKAVAANEQLSESIGIHAWGYRTLAFVYGSSIAGVAGVLIGNFNGIVNPSDFGAPFMFKIVAAAIVGGTSTFVGPLLGLLFLTALGELFRGTAEYIPLLWGISVIAALLFTGGGLEVVLAGIIRKLRGATHA